MRGIYLSKTIIITFSLLFTKILIFTIFYRTADNLTTLTDVRLNFLLIFITNLEI